MYVDYNYYATKYAGIGISENEFNACVSTSCTLVDRFTYQHLKGCMQVTDDVKSAVCAVVDVVSKHRNAETQRTSGIASESVGKHSVSYISDAERLASYEKEVMNAVDLFLPRSNLLRYSGV